MKIGIITPTPSLGGINRVAMETGFTLTKLGFDVDLLFFMKGSIPANEELLRTVDAKYLFESNHLKSTIGEFLSRSLYLTKRPKGTYDLIIAHGLPAARVAFRMWKKRRCPYLCYHYDPGAYTFIDPLYYLYTDSNGFSRKKEFKWLAQATAIITSSKALNQILKSRIGLESTVLYPSSSLVGSLSTDELPRQRDRCFLSVHRIGPGELFPSLVSVLENVKKMNLVIAGSTVRKRSDEKVVDLFNHVERQIRFVYNPSDEDLKRLYFASRGLLFPDVENFNLVALEAASFGCPVLTYKQSGIFELFEGKYEVGFFDESDLEGLSKMAQILFDDEERAIKIGKRQYEIASRYSLEWHTRELARIINANFA